MRAAASTLEAEPTPVPPPAGAAAPAPTPARYWAFLSYSHRDRVEADRLHKALEAYRLPVDLVGADSPAGPVPPRLHPIFRDREELTASADLGEGVRQALAESRALLVLCSPAAAVSRWTNAEIGFFRRLHPDAPVLAAILSGEPWASEIPGREAEECFPIALRRRWDKRGRITGVRAEPIAADLRPDGDGKTLGKLKLVAGLLGLPLDKLARREERRTRRRLAWAAAAGLAGTVLTGGLAVAAVDARDDARDGRDRAEGLIEFMLSDLRAELEPVGRLDVLDTLGARTLAYYREQDTSSLSSDALGRHARALHLTGEVAKLRGNLDAAERRFREAEALTAQMLAREPDNQQRIFDHAQSVFWVGYVYLERGRNRDAEVRFETYRRLASQLVSLDPRNPKWLLEGVYASNNLGVLLFRDRRYSRALAVFEEGLRRAETLVSADPGNRANVTQLIEMLGWVADARQRRGQIARSAAAYERQIALLQRYDRDGQDHQYMFKRMVAELGLSRLRLWRGEVGPATAHAQRAVAIGRGLRAVDPENSEWALGSARTAVALSRLLLVTGNLAGAAALAEEACALAEPAVTRTPGTVDWRTGALLPCLALRARVVSAQGGHASAVAMGDRALAQAVATGGNSLDAAQVVADAHELLGDLHAAAGRADVARAQWAAALAALPGEGESWPAGLHQRSVLLHRLGRVDEAREPDRTLAAIGYRHPLYTRSTGRSVGGGPNG